MGAFEDRLEFIRLVLNRDRAIDLIYNKDDQRPKESHWDLKDYNRNVYVEIGSYRGHKDAQIGIDQINARIEYTSKELNGHYLIVVLNDDEKIIDYLKNNIEYSDAESIEIIPYQEIVAIGQKFSLYPPEAGQNSLDLEIDDEKVVVDEVEHNNYFLAGHFWGDEDQFDRFVQDKVWENGHEKNDVDAVNSVLPGDRILLKSTYQQNGISYLRIKAIGVVLNNYYDGHNLHVVWSVLKEHVNIPNLGKYRRTFQRLMPNDTELVEEEINKAAPYLGEIMPDLVDEELRERPIKVPENLRQIYINAEKTLLIGQTIGQEIKGYNVYFLPKTAYGPIGKGGVSYALLEILGIDPASFDFDNDNFREKRFIWFRRETALGLIYFCFVISRDENKKYENFEKSLVNAINEFFNFEEITDKFIPRVFMPLLGAGAGQMPETESLTYLLTGVKELQSRLTQPAIRLNFSPNSPSVEIEIHVKYIYTQLNVIPPIMGGGPPINPPVDDGGNGGSSADSGHDKIRFHLDQVETTDRLDREPVAESLARLINQDIFSKEQNLQHSFMIHLQGEWGSGKSTFLNLLTKHLNTPHRKWLIVDYNAWENQHIDPPWWAFLSNIHRESMNPKKMPRYHKPILGVREIISRICIYDGGRKLMLSLLTGVLVLLILFFVEDILKLAESIMAGSNDSQLKKNGELFQIISWDRVLFSTYLLFYTVFHKAISYA